ncbi:MAG: carboxypeptidase regulatory-like domain-containing protein [Acidobacteria bacterium]|nr:carboxypeptidase regulatory-like domain-containing protein [Acidobacteriota bacterium]
MSARKSKLDQLNVAKPCSASWEEMTGNRQKRFCSECSKHVFDFSRMTRQQIEAVTAVHQGNLCARITRREDGSMVTVEPSLPISPNRRLHSPMLNAAVATILSLSVPAAAQPVAMQQVQIAAQSQDQKKKNDGAPEVGGVASISGTVVDPQQAVIVNAVVKLLAPNATPLVTRSSDEGTFHFTGVNPGVFTLMVESPGFRPSILTDVRLMAGIETPVMVTLDVNVAVTTGGVMISMPPSLLKLVQESELIAIATVGKSRVAQTEEESRQLQTALTISSVLKGDARQRVIPLYHWVSDATGDELKPGDQLLVFLDRRKSDDDKPIDGFEANDWSRSIRKLDDSALSAYQQRIEELNSILANEPPNNTELIEWMVRCIENPATRWDGVFELGKNLDALKELDKTAQGKAPTNPLQQLITAIANQKAKETQPEVAEEQEATENEEDDAPGNIASLLSPEQKARVTNALFSIETLSSQDMQLVELVKGWKEARLAPYLAAQLTKVAVEAPPIAEELVSVLAELLDDDAVQKTAEEYQNNVEYDESESQGEEEAGAKTKPKSVAAQIAMSKRSVYLVAFLAAVNQKLSH